MGAAFLINKDGSVSHYPTIKVINNIEWLDYKQEKGKYTVTQIAFLILCIFPIYGQLIYLLTSLLFRMICGFWPFFGIRAIEQTDEPIRVYCNKLGKLGLYAKKRRVTPARFDSVQQLPTIDYPAFILGREDGFCLYNYVQGKILFSNSEKITYLGDNTVLIRQNGKESKYSLIGMYLGNS